MAMDVECTRMRSDSNASTRSSRMCLRQSLLQLLNCVEDLSSGDEATNEVSRALDQAFRLCGRYNREFFRCTESYYNSMHNILHDVEN